MWFEGAKAMATDGVKILPSMSKSLHINIPMVEVKMMDLPLVRL